MTTPESQGRPVCLQAGCGGSSGIPVPDALSPLSPWPAPRGSTRSYHAMVKPTGSICNLDCTYCYYLHKKELFGSNNKFRISDEILETHIRQYIQGQDRSEVVFSQQGGEPTLRDRVLSEGDRARTEIQKIGPADRERSPDERDPYSMTTEELFSRSTTSWLV